MKWDDRNLLRIAFLIVVLLLSIAIRTNSQPCYLLSGAALSAVISIFFVERIIEAERERQWERVRLSTYRDILKMISLIALNISRQYKGDIRSKPKECIHLKGGGFIFLFWDPEEKIIEQNLATPKKEVAIAIINIAKSIETIVIKENIEFQKLETKKDRNLWHETCNKKIEKINKCYSTNQHLFEGLRVVLIPRVLQLSSNQEINTALVRFDSNIRGLESSILERGKILQEGVVFSRLGNVFTPFLNETGILYEILQYELQNVGDSGAAGISDEKLLYGLRSGNLDAAYDNLLEYHQNLGKRFGK